MWEAFLPWLKGIIAVFGFAFAQTIVEVAGNPDALGADWKTTLTKGIVAGASAVALYFADSPLAKKSLRKAQTPKEENNDKISDQ